jgi:vitamin B12 transporter
MGPTRISILLALGAQLLAANADLAEPPRPRAEAGATVTVTAEATDVEVAKTPNQIVVIDKEAIAASGSTTVTELLADAFPGQVFNNGGVGTVTSLFLGGSRSQDVVVTLDGIRLTDSSGLGSVNTNSIGLAGIERVEIETGPSSSRFGADAMGGVVALYTAGSAPKGLSGSLVQKLGTQGIAGLQLATAYGWDSGWVRFSGDAYREDQATPTPEPFRAAGTFVGLGQQLGEETLVTLSYRNSYSGVPIPYATVEPTLRVYKADRESRNRNQQVLGTVRTALAPQWSAELTLGQALVDRKEPGFPSGFSAFDSRRNQALGRLGWAPTERHRLSLSLDTYEEFASTPGFVGKDKGAGRHLGLDLEGSCEPTESLRFLAAVRQQWDRQNFQQGTSAVPGADSNSSHGTWKVGANARLSETFRVYASAGTAFGLPLLSAVMYNASSGATTPLEREDSRFVNLGASWSQGPWEVKLEATRTSFKHLVFFDLNTFLYANGSDLRTQSAQLSAGYKAGTWGLEGFYRNQEARDLKAPKELQLATSAVVRRPFNSLGLKGHALVGAFRFDVRWSWFGPRYENFGGFPATLGASKVHFNDLAAGATWKVRENLTLALRGEHLLQPKLTVSDWENRSTDGDNDAYQIFGFPAQPPTWTLEARYRF